MLLLLDFLTPVELQAQGIERGEWRYSRHPDSAFLVLKDLYSKAIARKDPVAMGSCLQQMGQICYYLGNYSQALDFHLKADKIFREQENRERVAANLGDMGILYYYNRQHLLARKQYEEALAIYRQLDSREGMAAIYGKIGHLYEKRQEYDSAFFFQRMALDQYKGIDRKQGVAKIYENIGSIYEDLAKYDSAWYYFQLSLDLNNRSGEVEAAIEVVNNLGDICRKTGRYTEALVYTGRALQLARQTNDLYQQGAAYRDLGKAWHLLHRDDSAYVYLELSRRATIDIYSLENNRQTAFLSVLYEIDKKNDEIVRLENVRKINLITGVAALVVTVLLAVLAWVIISRQRMKIRNQRELGEQNQRIYEAKHELMQAELVNRQLEEDRLVQELEANSRELAANNRELEVKKKGLTSYTLHIIQKNQLLEELREKLTLLVKDDKRDQKKQLQSLIQQINMNFNHDQYWNEFREVFEQVHQQFFDKLKARCADLTGNDLRLLALIRLNLGSGDIATLLGISPDSLRVSRYRIKKKLQIGTGESLTAFVQSL